MKEHFSAQVAHAVRRATWPGWMLPERTIPNYELVLLLRGQGRITLRSERLDVQAGDLLLFCPGVRHSLWVEAEPCMDFIGIHFELPPGVEMLPFPEVMHLEKGSRLEPLFKEVVETYVRKTYLYKWRQNVLMEQILCETSIVLKQKHAPADGRRIQRVLDFIHADPYRSHSLDELSTQAGIKKTQFLQAFRNVTGTTPKQYMLTLRLEHARDLLLETDWPIAHIAEKTGFEDAFYFSRCFRQRFSRSPRAFRLEYSGEVIPQPRQP